MIWPTGTASRWGSTRPEKRHSQLDDRWTKQDDGSYDFNGGAEADGGLTLETSLTPVETGDPASEAVQQQVFTLEHSNG